MGDADKICRICGEDCAGRPRTKDAKGRYYCQPCYDEALARQRAVRAEATAPPAVEPESVTAPDSMLDIPSVGTCPSCGRSLADEAVLCMHCGFNRQSGEQIEVQQVQAPTVTSGGLRERIAELGEWTEVISTPFGASVLTLLALWGVFGLCFLIPAFLIPYVLGLTALVFVMTVVTIIDAFREGFLHGAAVLVFPLYQPYFVWFVTDNQWVRWLWTVTWTARLTPVVVGLLIAA
jgi:hypothetical protein